MLDAVGTPVGGGRPPSSFLIATGLATAPLTAAAGWADWAESHEDQMRVGIVHAAANGVALSLYAAALVARRAAAGAGCCRWPAARWPESPRCSAATWATGRQPARTTARRSRTSGPSSGSRSARSRTSPSGKPVQRRGRRRAGVRAAPRATGSGRTGSACCPTAARTCPARCTRATSSTSGGEAHVVCPWHGSEFRVSDGCVVHGPATAPVPRFEARVVGDELQARVVTLPGVPAS